MAMITRAFLEKQFKNFAAKISEVFSRKKDAAHSLDVTMDSDTYKITIKLLNESEEVLSTKTVDLPLETTVVSGKYDQASKTLVLTLENGSELKIGVGDLVSGYLPLAGGKMRGGLELIGGGVIEAADAASIAYIGNVLDANSYYTGMRLQMNIGSADTANPVPIFYTKRKSQTAWEAQYIYTTAHKPTAQDVSALPTTGGTLTGDLTLSGDARFIKFASGVRTGNVIRFYKGDNNGSGVVIGNGGRTIIGGGESADNLHDALGTTTTDESLEEMHIGGDSVVQVHTNCQTIGQRKTFTFGADGSLAVPSGGMFKGKATKAEHIMEVSLSGNTIDFRTWAETPANVLHNVVDTYGGETTIVRYHWSGTSGSYSNMHLPCVDSHIVIHAIPTTDSSGKLTFLWCTAYDIRSRAIYTCMKSLQTNGWTNWTALTGTDGVVATAGTANAAYALLPLFLFEDDDFREYVDKLSRAPKVTGGAFLTTYMVTREENISTYHLPSMSGYIIGIYDPVERTNKAKYIAYDGSTNAMWSCTKTDGIWTDWVKILNEDGSPAASSGPKIYHGVCDTEASSGNKHVTIPGGFTNSKLEDGTLFAVRFTEGNSSISTFSLAMGTATSHAAYYGDEAAGSYIYGTDLSVTRNYYLFMYDASIQKYRLLGPQTTYSKPSSNNLTPGSDYKMILTNKTYLYSIGNLYILYLDITINSTMIDDRMYTILSIPYDAGIHNNYFDGRIYAATKNGKTLEFYMTSTSINIVGKSDVEVGDRVCVQYCFLNS